MKYVNTNSHRVELVLRDDDGAEVDRRRIKGGREFDATGELADLAEDTPGVYRDDSDEVAAWRSQQQIADVAGSGDASHAVEASFDPGELKADEAIEAIGRVTDPAVLDEITKTERDGRDRTTVIEAAGKRREVLEGSGGTGTVTSGDVPAKK